MSTTGPSDRVTVSYCTAAFTGTEVNLQSRLKSICALNLDHSCVFKGEALSAQRSTFCWYFVEHGGIFLEPAWMAFMARSFSFDQVRRSADASALQGSWQDSARLGSEVGHGKPIVRCTPLMGMAGNSQRAQVPRQLHTQLGLKNTISSILTTVRP